MDRTGQQALAGAGFSEDENGKQTTGRSLMMEQSADLGLYGRHARAFTDQFSKLLHRCEMLAVCQEGGKAGKGRVMTTVSGPAIRRLRSRGSAHGPGTNPDSSPRPGPSPRRWS